MIVSARQKRHLTPFNLQCFVHTRNIRWKLWLSTVDSIEANYKSLLTMTRGIWLELFAVAGKQHWGPKYIHIQCKKYQTYPASRFHIL